MSPRRKRLKYIKWVNRRGWITFEEIVACDYWPKVLHYSHSFTFFYARRLGNTWRSAEEQGLWVNNNYKQEKEG